MTHISNKHNTKNIVDHLYDDLFLPAYYSHTYTVSSATFSDYQILDCLEKERVSSKTMKDFIVNTVPNKTGANILILGAGSGRNGSELRKTWPSGLIYEIDINPAVIERLRQKHARDIHRKPLLGDGNVLPVPTNSIDIIHAYSVFRYVKNPKKIIEEIQRTLKPGGYAFIAEGKNSQIIYSIRKYIALFSNDHQLFTIQDVLLPRLTFFYWLLTERATNASVNSLIEATIAKDHLTHIEAAFKIAGSTKDTVYGVFWKK